MKSLIITSIKKVLFLFLIFINYNVYSKGSDKILPVEIDLNSELQTQFIKVKKEFSQVNLKLKYISPVKNIQVTFKKEGEFDRFLPVSNTEKVKDTSKNKENILEIPNIAPGDKYDVTIKFQNVSDKEYHVIIEKEPTYYWGITYGNNFILNRALYPRVNESFFTKDNGSSGLSIGAKKGEEWIFAPSITYVAMENTTKSILGYCFGGSLGLETNSATPTVSAGIGIHLGYKLQIMTGLIFHQVYKLNDQYTEGQSLSTSLTTDQLGTKTYTPDIFFSIGLRFDKNPKAE